MKFFLWIWVGIGFSSCGQKANDADSQFANTFGTDNRVKMDVAGLPGSAIGRLETGCTAVMVGKSLALTSAHCVYDTDQSRLKKDLDLLNLGYVDGKARHQVRVSAAWIGTKDPLTERFADWAILLLDSSVGDTTGWFGVAEGVDHTKLPYTVNLAGYATNRDSGNNPYVHTNCYIHKEDDYLRLLHDCDAGTGTSGGPMFFETQSGPFIVALTAAEFISGDTSMNVNQYSHEYANIAVNANQFQKTLGELRTTIDIGRLAPEFRNAFYFANTNPSQILKPETNLTPVRPPVPPPSRESPAVHQNWINQRNQIFSSRQWIQQEALKIDYLMQQIIRYSVQYRSFDLGRNAQGAKQISGALTALANSLANGHLPLDSGIRDLIGRIESLDSAVMTFRTYFLQVYTTRSREYRDLGQIVFSLAESTHNLSTYVKRSNSGWYSLNSQQ